MARSTDGLTQADTGLHADGFIDVFFEDRTDFLVFFQRQVIQGDTFVDTDQNKLSDDAVGITEWYTMFYKIIGSISSVGETIFAAGSLWLCKKFSETS